MLELRNIVKTYKPKNGPEVKALKSVSVKFQDKGLVFILGKSGCGKSTLLNCIGGLDTFDSGEIIIKGKSSLEFSGSDFDSYRNTFIGFIFQEYNILSEFNIEKNIALALELQGKKADKQAVQEILDMVDLGNMGKRKTTELSGGQKQRVAIARALIKDPEIIIADEPTGALDSATGVQVFETLKKLAQEKLIIVVSHDREFAEIYGDRIIEMKDGVIISDETKRKVEPNAVSDDLTMIGDDMIHIKKGHKFTADEKEMIIKFLESRDTETIISVDEAKNQKFKKVAKIDENNHTEKFTETTDEDRKLKQYDKNELKLIKSQLKWKDSFKMGASSLKTKPVRLVFTILLSFIAFTIFGVVDTLSTFNRAKAVWDTVSAFDNKYVSLMKEVPGDYGNDIRPWTEADVTYVNENYPDITIKKVVNAGMNFGGSYYPNWENNRIQLSAEGLTSTTSNVFKAPFYSGMTNVTAAELETLGFTVVGKLPTADNEIAISKHIFDCIKELNADKITTAEAFVAGTGDYNKIYINNLSGTKTVVGVIDDKTDLSEYADVTTEQLNKDHTLEEKIARELSFGFANMLYVNNAVYTKALNEKIDMSGFELVRNGERIGYYGSDFASIDEKREDIKYGNTYEFRNCFNVSGLELLNYDREFATLTGSIVVDDAILEAVIGPNYQYEILHSGTPKYIDVTNSDGTPIKSLKIVGYSEGEYSLGGTAIISTADVAEFSAVSGGVKFVYDGTEITGLTKYADLQTIFDTPNTPWAVSVDDVLNQMNMAYLKAGVDITNLGDNDIIINEDSFRDLATGEELYQIIEAGLTVEFKLGSENAPAMFTFNIVGVTQHSGTAYVSAKTLAETIDPNFTGFDYAIAILSDDASQNEKFIKFCETMDTTAKRKFTVQNGATGILDSFGEIITEVASVFFYVGLGFAVFAGLLLMNFISTSISYKKREIGILRALGARSSDVFGIFFNESLVIALINFVLATIATFVASTIISSVIITKLGLELVLLATGIRQVLLILGVSLLTAFVASFFPVIKIAKKQPIDAINNR